MGLHLVEGPAEEPLSLATAKVHLRRGNVSADDALIKALTKSARERAEQATARALLTQTWDLVLDRWPCEDYIEIPLPPLQRVAFVKYVNTAGTLTTLTEDTHYVVKTYAGPRCKSGRVGLVYGQTWPSTYGQIGDITIRFVAGYGDAQADVPGLLQAAMLLDLGTLYLDRERVVAGSVSELPGGVRDIYWSHKAHGTTRMAS